MIFFIENLGVIDLPNGKKVNALPTNLKDGRMGFRLSSDKLSVIEGLNVEYEHINENDIEIPINKEND